MFKNTAKSIIYGAMLIGSMSMASCTDSVMDEINKNEATPDVSVVNAKFQVTDAIMSTAFTTYGGSYAWYVSIYNEQFFGTGNNQFKKAEMREAVETAASTTYENEWNGTYSNLQNIKQIIDKCQEGGLNEGNNDLLGMAQVLWVLNAGALTDLHGDIPYSEAFDQNNLQPNLDSQESIYNDLLDRCDAAMTALNAAIDNEDDNVGGQDILFGGDCSQWLALAHAVKARLLLHTSFRNPAALAQAGAEAQAAIDGGFDGAAVKTFNGVDCDNSWSAFWWSRAYIGSSSTVANLMAERQDPRYGVYNLDYFGNDLCPNPGDREAAVATETVNAPSWLDSGDAPLEVFGKSEIYFILAEVQARTGADASEAFAAGITAAFEDMEATDAYMGFSADYAADYIASLGTPTLEEIMVQKYLSQIRDQQIETYNDLRRCKAMGEEFVKMHNPHNVNGSGANQLPLRLAYGNSDVVSNPNVAAAFGSGNDAGNYVFTEPIWLFGGSK